MENFQALCLGAGAAWFVCAVRQTQIRAAQVLFLALALFFISFLVREIEVKYWDLPSWLAFILDGKPRNIWVGSLWLVVFILFLGQARAVWAMFLQWIRTPAGKLLLAGGAAYVLPWPLDKGLISLPKPTAMFLEELSETAATLLMSFSAMATSRHARQMTVMPAETPAPSSPKQSDQPSA